MGNRNIRYGLNLDRGLYFEGRLSTTNAQRLGAYMLASLIDTERTALNPHRLDYLQGYISGVAANSTSVPERRIKLTTVPVIGSFSLSSIERIRADLVAVHPIMERPDDELSITGTGILHIPKLSVFRKYLALLPNSEYLTRADEIINDTFLFHLDRERHLNFSISVDPDTLHNG